tara:strand:- start:71 stop:205 length:135 start_codon:yes stop_codon:yes gene_type:complete
MVNIDKINRKYKKLSAKLNFIIEIIIKNKMAKRKKVSNKYTIEK